jgi:subtilisin family serine protease
MTKVDAKLLRQLALLKEGGSVRPTDPVRVLLRFSKDLDEIKAHGFTAETVIGEVAIGVVNLGQVEQLAALDNVVHIESEQLRRLHLKDSVPEIHADQVWHGVPSITGAGVAVGIVDTGIDIFHKSFRNSDGSTRIRYIWDQTLTPQGAEKSPPAGFVGGVEFDWTDINAALATPDKPFRHVDLEGHGTHTAGTGAGNGSQSGDCHLANTYVGVAPGASLIIVKCQIDEPTEYGIIPAAAPFTVTVANVAAWASNNWVAYYVEYTALKLVTANPAAGEYSVAAGVYTFNAADAGKAILISYVGIPGVLRVLNTSVLAGASYVFQRAQTAGPGLTALPAVLSLSLGGEMGAHDGTGAEEIALDGLVATSAGPIAGRAIVISAGNDGRKDGADPHTRPGAGLHAFDTIFSNAHQTLTFVIQPNDHRVAYIDLWYSGAGRLSYTLTTPSGASVTADAAHPNINQVLGTDTVSITWSINNSSNNKGQVYLTISPPAPTPPVAPATVATRSAIATGSWTIQLQETAGANVEFDCWIEIDSQEPGPYFIASDQDFTRTICVPGTANNLITVGAYDPSDSSLAVFSSRGPAPGVAMGSHRQKPDITGPGVGIVAPKSGKRSECCVCDCCLDFYVPKDGTSMAAPHVAGVAALMFQKTPTATSQDIKTSIQNTARIPIPIPDMFVPNYDWGFGQVDAFEAVHSIGSLNPVPNGAPKPKLVPAPGKGTSSLGTKAPSARRGNSLPLAAMWSTYLPPRKRLQDLSARLQADPVGQLLAVVVSNNFDEVYRLVNSNRRVATCWHRIHGPMLLREFTRSIEQTNVPLVAARIEGDSISAGFSRTLAILARYGSPNLRADIDRYGPLIIGLPGVTMGDLHRLSELTLSENCSCTHFLPAATVRSEDCVSSQGR